jgi:hypothetical protein
LACLAYCLEPRENYDATKIKTRLIHVLDALVSAAVEESAALNDPKPTMKTVQGLWTLKSSLSILEQSCFACPQNQSALNSKTVNVGCPPLEKMVTFNQWLVSQIRTLTSHNKQLPDTGLKKDCFLLLISVLMNTTEGDKNACCDLHIDYLGSCLIKLHRDDSEKSHSDEMSALIGVLINIIDEVGTLCIGDEALLYEMIDSLCQIVEDRTTGAGFESVSPSRGEDIVTVESLEQKNRSRQTSSVAVYSAILLGFLAANNEQGGLIRCKIADRLGSLDPLVELIEQTLNFYMTVGAVTEKSSRRLACIIERLKVEG